MVSRFKNFNEILINQDSGLIFNSNIHRQKDKYKNLRKILFNSLNNKYNSYHCVFPDCNKSFPTYFRWKIHHIIDVRKY